MRMKRNLILLIAVLSVAIYSCKEQSSDTAKSTAQTDLYTSTKGKGAPMIIIHGGPGLSAAYIEDHLDPLSQDFQLIFYDQRNSGRNQIDMDSTKMSLTGFLQDIDVVRQSYGYDKVHILAHSWGGLLGMQYALHYPQHVDKLILANSIAPVSTINQKNDVRLANLFSADDLEARNRIIRSEAYKNQDAKAYEELMHIGFGYLFDNRNLIRELRLDLPSDYAPKSIQLGHLFKDFSSYDYTEALSTLEAPTLLISGIKDPGTPLALNALIAAMPKARIKGLDDAGHFPFIEQPQAFADEIKSFLTP